MMQGGFKSGDLHVVTEDGEQCFMWKSNQLTYIAQDRQELPQILATKFGPFATKLDLSFNSMERFDNINHFTNLSELILDNNNFSDEQIVFKRNLRLKTLSLNKNKLKNLSKLVQKIQVSFPNLEYLSLIGNPLCPVSIQTIETGIECGVEGEGEGAVPAEEDDPKSGHHEKQPPDGSVEIKGSKNCRQNQRGKAVGLPKISIDELILEGSSKHQASQNSSQNSIGLFDEINHRKYRHFIIFHLPNLKFLDSAEISLKEREEALTGRCLVDRQAFLSLGNRQELVPVRSQDSSKPHVPQPSDFKLSIMCQEDPEYGQEPPKARDESGRLDQQTSPKGKQFERNRSLFGDIQSSFQEAFRAHADRVKRAN